MSSHSPQSRARDCSEPSSPRLLPGVVITAVGVAGSLLAHRVADQVGVLTWSVLLGAVAANLNLIPGDSKAGLQVVTRKCLRVGVVLLGFSLSLVAIASLGFPIIALVVVTLCTTLLATTWIGLRIGIGRPRSLLIATGFAICGASAIAAMEENAEADEEDVAAAIAMVTICGTVVMVALPLLQAPLGLTDTQFGVWAGASVHEVGQVVAAASPAGAAAVAVAIVVKLTRVVLLAPVVAAVAVLRRRRSGPRPGMDQLPPLVPLFVVGFLACVLVRSTGVVGPTALHVIESVQVLALSAALFGLGTGVVLRSLVRSSGPALLLAGISTVVIACVSFGGALLVV